MAHFIRTPDQRLRVFVSSTLQELADERIAAREAIRQLHLTPVMFELGARPHPPRDLYRAYLEQSHIFIGLYWQRYGWVAPGESISGLEDEYLLSGERPKLIYIKTPAPEREPQLQALLDRIKSHDKASYKSFATPTELRELIVNDLAVLLSERFEMTQPGESGDDRVRLTRHDTLPTPPTPLIDRAEERAELSALLQRDDVALITLTGPAGTGKSRLGVQVASDLLDHFTDGAVFVALAAIRDPHLVIQTIAQTLEIRETAGGPPLAERLRHYLRSKHMLLELDNFEQVVTAAPEVAALLAQCRRLKALITSRTPLHVRGEQEFPVSPLALPERETHSPVEQLAQSPAIALFVQRAQNVKPDFTLTAEDVSTIAEICRQLDGLPLAIELAAARIKVLSTHALLTRLTDGAGSRLALLTGGARDLPAHQRTMRKSLDWSYELLNDDARMLFRRVAVFDGGWMLEAAEAICNADNRLGGDILEHVQALHDMSLLMQHDMPDGEPRFSMLQTIHEYAHECLAHDGEGDGMRRHHAAYFLHLAERAEPELQGDDRERWLNQLEQEKDNLRAAMAWATGAEGDRQLALRLAVALSLFWRIRGYFSEGRQWLEALLAHRAELAPTRELARALESAGYLTWAQGDDLAAARALIEDSLAIGRDLNDQKIIAQALFSLGITLMTQGEPAAAGVKLQESVAQFHAAHDESGEAGALNHLGIAMMMTGDFEQARSRYEDSLALSRTLGDPLAIAGGLSGLGALSLVEGDEAMAQRYYEEATALQRRVGDRYSLAWTLSYLGFAVLFQKDVQRAQTLFDESMAFGRVVGNPWVAVLYLAGMGGIAAVRSQTESPEHKAADLLRAARLTGAADRLSHVHSVTLWNKLPDIYNRWLDSARSQMDAATWDAAVAEGQAMTLDQALAYASAGAA
jgi:predicted ATPase